MEKLAFLNQLHQELRTSFLRLSIIEINSFLDQQNGQENRLENKWIEQLEKISALIEKESLIIQSINLSQMETRKMLEKAQRENDLSFENIISNIENISNLRKYFLLLNQYRDRLSYNVKNRNKNQYFQIIVFYQMFNCLLQNSTNVPQFFPKLNHLKNLIYYSCPGVDPELDLIDYEKESTVEIGLSYEEYLIFKNKSLTESFCDLLAIYEKFSYETFLNNFTQIPGFLIWGVYRELLEGNISKNVLEKITDDRKIKLILKANDQYVRNLKSNV